MSPHTSVQSIDFEGQLSIVKSLLSSIGNQNKIVVLKSKEINVQNVIDDLERQRDHFKALTERLARVSAESAELLADLEMKNGALANATAESAELMAQVEERNDTLSCMNKELARSNAYASELMAEIEIKNDQIEGLNGALANANAQASEILAELEIKKAHLLETQGLLEMERDNFRKHLNTYKLMTENQKDVVLSIAVDGTLEYVSPSIRSFAGYDPEDEIGRNIMYYLADPEEFGKYVDTIREMIDRTTSGKFQLMFKPKEGKPFPVEVNAMPHLEGGSVRSFNCMMRDITERVESENLRNEFLSILTHDIGTPLMALDMSIDILMREMNGPFNDRQMEILANMKKSAHRLKLLRDDTLQLSKFDLGIMELDISEVDLGCVIRDSVAGTRAMALKKGISINLQMDPTPVLCDVAKMKRVMDNLLSNAVKYTVDGRNIDISSHTEGDAVVVSIRDEGRGLEKDDLEKVFERFYRTGERVEGSTGLGLAIVKEIIKSHGGKAWAESKGMGCGSTFSFTLPLRRSAGHPAGT